MFFTSACRTRVILSTIIFFFFNDPATTEIYTLSLHDALPISSAQTRRSPVSAILVHARPPTGCPAAGWATSWRSRDRKSTRLNSSHLGISYAVFCLKKKKKKKKHNNRRTNAENP